MKIIEVGEDEKLKKDFINFAVKLYQNNAYWIRPLDKDIEHIFDRKQNPKFLTGDAIRFLAFDENNQVIGRVAAFYDNKTATIENEQATGGIGFFECIESQEVAFALFDTCREWLKTKGMEAMDGPINFGERDNWWGLLVEPFDLEPSWGMQYHLPYYRAFFENYGFQDYFQQYTFWLPIPEEEARKVVRPALFEIANRIYKTEGYDFRHVDKKQLYKFAEDFRIIYNKAWVVNKATGEMTSERAQSIMKMFKPILEPELMWFGYFNQQPIAFFIMIPDLNQIFKYVNGKLDWIGKLKFLYHKLMKTNHKARGVIFGVIPEFQNRGIESAIALSFSRACWTPNYQYKELELNWIGDFNPKMLKVTQLLGAKKYKTYITYRYLFDRNKEFKRHPKI
jgi:hypothetical protein